MKDNYETLEYPVILGLLKSYCVSEDAKLRVKDLRMYEDHAELKEELERVQEAMLVHRLLGRLPLSHTRNITMALKKAEMDGTLSSEELWDVFLVLRNVRSLHSYFSSYEDEYVYLRDLVEGLHGDDYLADEIERCIEPDLSISDHASPELYRIRRQIHSLNDRIRKQMESYLKDNKDVLSMDNLTTKNNHLVLPVKANQSHQFKGIVHATSATGQTHFIEPERVVAMNNELNVLKSDEQEEIHRILYSLSRYVRRVKIHLSYDQEIMNTLDFIFAKARFGVEYDCVKPEVGSATLMLKGARHPLIDQEKVVANDIILDNQMLMITGSNTGGKTVTLKTAGLLSLMALSGMMVPCIDAQVPFYDEVYVDVGDEQSIEQSLSTYSSHMKRLIEITRQAGSHSLVLIDEIGSGTDPREGAALAKAIISALLKKGCTILISTHYGELKTFGELHPDIDLASVGFDLESMKPTYKLKLHTLGLSYAFEIAQSLGLDEDIIQEGQRYKEESISKEERLMEDLQKRESAIKEKEEQLLKDEEETKLLLDKYERQLAGAKKEKEQILKKARDDANKVLDESKAMIDEVVKELRQKGTLKDHEVIAAKHDLEELKFKEKKKEKVQTHVFAIGDQVRVDSMNREGEVVRIGKNGEVTVSLSGLPIKIKNTELTYLHGKKKPVKKKASTRTHVKKTGSYEVNVIGMRYNEAMETVDKFIDDALMLGYPSIRIIHGMGTGALRKGVRQLLKRKSFVDHFTDGGPNEGGLGATLVHFK